jgi:hypothetical protein
MYAWDEALEDLYSHICQLVSLVALVYGRMQGINTAAGN